MVRCRARPVRLASVVTAKQLRRICIVLVVSMTRTRVDMACPIVPAMLGAPGRAHHGTRCVEGASRSYPAAT